MNDCTRLSHSLLAVRHVEVHGTFLTFFLKIVGRTVCPPSVVRKTILAARDAAAATTAALAGDAARALARIDISLPSNHSFIQLFELQLRLRGDHDMPSDQTRAAILTAAERLYADRGFGDVTLRDIVAAADVNLAAVNYHFGSKDELIAELFVTRSLATNRERLNELKAAEAAGGGRADIDAILRALVGPTLRGCLGPDRERSTAARFMIRASIESVPPIRRIKNREIDHLRKFAAAMRRSLPDRSEVDLYWGLHFALAMAHQTIRDSERLTKLSEGCDLTTSTASSTHRRGVGDGADEGRGTRQNARPAVPRGTALTSLELTDIEGPSCKRRCGEDSGNNAGDRVDSLPGRGRGALQTLQASPAARQVSSVENIRSSPAATISSFRIAVQRRSCCRRLPGMAVFPTGQETFDAERFSFHRRPP